jgi:hypothetical protein
MIGDFILAVFAGVVTQSFVVLLILIVVAAQFIRMAC